MGDGSGYVQLEQILEIVDRKIETLRHQLEAERLKRSTNRLMIGLVAFYVVVYSGIIAFSIATN